MSDQDKGEQLYWACTQGKTEEGLTLIQDATTNINWTDSQRNTPLTKASSHNHPVLVQALLEREDLLPNQAGMEGRTALFYACQQGHHEIVKQLSRDPRVEVNQGKSDGITPFMIACANGHIEAVRHLLRDARVDVNKGMRDATSPLWLASSNGHVDVVRAILAAGTHVDALAASSFNNSSPAQQARFRGHRDLADLIELYCRDPRMVVTEMRKELQIKSFSSLFSLLSSLFSLLSSLFSSLFSLLSSLFSLSI